MDITLLASRLALAGSIVLTGLAPASAAPPRATTTVSGPAIFGMPVAPIRGDRFLASWHRADADARSNPLLRAIVAPAMAMTPDQKIAFVQAAVAKRIRWASDATQWGRHDYWASAAETLKAGAGDGEDRAIVKLQALRALGFSPHDLFLTMARDSVGGPMTVLTVRRGGSFLILPDSGSPFQASSRRFEFKPLLSLGGGTAWLHVQSAKPALAKALPASFK